MQALTLGPSVFAIGAFIALVMLMEGFFKTLKYKEVCLGEYEAFEDVIAGLPHFIKGAYNLEKTAFGSWLPSTRGL